MRDIQRRSRIERARMHLRRSADGRLRPASQEADIADIWAEQKRLQLKEAIAEQERRKLKKQLRKERGLFGWRHAASRKAIAGQAPAGPNSGTGESAGRPAGRPNASAVEIHLNLPKLRLPPLHGGARLFTLIRRKRKTVSILAGILLLLVSVTILKSLAGTHRNGQKTADRQSAKTSVLSAASQKPEFDTILPAGKTIEKLGGWGRVSPPGADPVFAYSDTLGNMHIVVSEQELPKNFSEDLSGSLARVAKQFSATKKLNTPEGTEMYLGSAANGSQSLITSKNGLLILIRSSGIITDQLWADYVYALE